jgi:serine protease Do
MKGSLIRSKLFPGPVAGILGLLVLLSAAAALPAVAPPPPKQPLPAFLELSAPVNSQELRTMQDHVKKVLKKVIPATVGIRVGMAAGSGVIIDAEGHVLTAGHVSGRPDRNCEVILPNGKVLKAKTLGQNRLIDSGLIQIIDKPEKGKTWDFIPMGDSSKLKPGQWCIAVGQPGGFRPGRSPVVRVGRVQVVNKGLIQTDCTLVGGDSGGPLFDMEGRVIGIHSRIANPITFNIHVPVNTYRETWEHLVKGTSWASTRPPNAGYIGISFAFGSDNLVVSEITEKSPAENAGIKVGDIVTAINGKKLSRRSELAEYMESKKMDDEITLEIRRDDTSLTIKLKLGKRPAE